MVEQSRSGALRRGIVVGTVLQLVMVVAGHWVAAIAALFAILGMAISAVAGWLAARWTGASGGAAAGNGAIAGGVCALIGIVVSYALGDVTAAVIAFGTLSSAVTGAIGGWAAWWGARRGVTAVGAG